MTYNVFGGTLSLTQSINQSIYVYGSFDNVEQWKWNCGGQVVKADSLSARFPASCWRRLTMQSPPPRALCSSPTRRSTSVASSSAIDYCCSCSTVSPIPAALRSRIGRGSCCRTGSSGHRYRTCPHSARPSILLSSPSTSSSSATRHVLI